MKLSDIRLKRREKPSELSEEAIREAPDEKKLKNPFAMFGAESPSAGREGRLPILPVAENALPQTLTIARVALAVALILVSVLVKTLPETVVLILRIVAAVGVGFDIVWKTVSDIRSKFFSCDGLPVILAVILAFANGMSLEAVVAITTLQIALCLRSYAYCRTKNAMLSSISLPASSSELNVGDSFMLEGGQSAPADCRIIQGSITADLSFISGRRTEKPMKTGDVMPAGCAVLSGSALAEVTRLPAESAAFGIAAAMEGGYDEPTGTERAINSAANLIMPVFLAVSVILLIILTLVSELSFAESLRRVITIIAVSSPCGVLVVIPLAYLASMAERRKRGVVFLSAPALEGAAFAKTVVFEKTGTITLDVFEVSGVQSDKMDSATFLKVAAHAVCVSDNPLARAIVSAFGEPVTGSLVSGFLEYPGWGVSVTVNEIGILLGTVGFMEHHRIQVPRVSGADCTVFMAVGGILAGQITLNNSLDHAAVETVVSLVKNGACRIAMVSGDSRERDSEIAREAGIGEYFSECSDDEKARYIKELRSRVDAKSTLVYVSGPDGSAGARRSADLGVVVNTFDVNALEGGADVLILGPTVENLPEALLSGVRARRVVIACAISGIALKLAIAVLAAMGVAPLWFGVLLDSCASLALITGSYTLSKPEKV